jgi:hypothetical protein
LSQIAPILFQSSSHSTLRIFRPIAFKNNQAILPFKQAPQTMHMANLVINEDTGASLEYRHLIQDDSTFPVCNKAAANEFG